MKTSTTALVLATVASLLLLTGCAAAGEPEPQAPADASAPSAQEPNSTADDAAESGDSESDLIQQGPPITVDFQCGQISLLGTYRLRLDQGFSSSEAGEAGKQAQEEMFRDLWASTLDGKDDVGVHIRAIQRAIKSGDRAEYDKAYGEASQACTANGSGIAMKFLPGEGG